MPDKLARYDQYFAEAEAKYKLPADLLRAIAQVESGGNPYALGQSGEVGLMQFMPSTARRYGLTPGELYEPEKAIDAAGRYISDLRKLLGDDTNAAIRAYNAGETGYRRGGLAYRQSGGYLRRVLGAWGQNVPGAELRGEASRKENLATQQKVQELKTLFANYDASLGWYWPGNWPALLGAVKSGLTANVLVGLIGLTVLFIGVKNA